MFMYSIMSIYVFRENPKSLRIKKKSLKSKVKPKIKSWKKNFRIVERERHGVSTPHFLKSEM